MAAVKNAQGMWVDSITGLPVTDLGNVGTDVGTKFDQTLAGSTVTTSSDGLAKTKDNSTGLWDTLKSSFTPEGTSGKSYAGNVMDAVGTGVNAATGLAGMYFANKNYELQKDQAEYLKNREAQSDARKSAFAANVGNGASY